MSSWLLVILISCVFAAPGGCDFGDTLSPARYEALLQQMKDKGWSDDKLKVLGAFAANNTLGMTSNQTVGIINQFGMSDDKVKAINNISAFILTLECSGIIAILKPIQFSNAMLDGLRILINLANEANLKMFNETIVELWGMSTDKALARQIIANSKPRSCLFGPANIPLFAFIIDVSGSMREQFRDSDGITYSRLGYVQKDLMNVMNGTLSPSQQFNIISFSTTARAWQPGVVPANAANIQSAGVFVNNLRADGGTYMLNALKLAFSDTKVLGVYFLSDGDPSDDQNAIITFAQSVRKPVNTIAFKAPVTGQKFLLRLANSTRGTFRNIV